MRPTIKTALLTALSIIFYSNASAESVSLDGVWKLDFWEQKREPTLSPLDVHAHNPEQEAA